MTPLLKTHCIIHDGFQSYGWWVTCEEGVRACMMRHGLWNWASRLTWFTCQDYIITSNCLTQPHNTSIQFTQPHDTSWLRQPHYIIHQTIQVMILSTILLASKSLHICSWDHFLRCKQHERHNGMALGPWCAAPNAILPHTPAIQASLRPPGSSGSHGPFKNVLVSLFKGGEPTSQGLGEGTTSS